MPEARSIEALYNAGSHYHTIHNIFLHECFAECAPSGIIIMIGFSRANNSIRINHDGDDGIRIRATSRLPLNVVGRLGVWAIR